MATCGEVLVQLLDSQGVDTVFGIPGVHTVELYRGLPNSRLRHVTPRHEQGAGFMADGYARATGKVAACFIITGPGLTNITTPMAQAYGDSVPMLVISSVNHSWELGLGEGRLHELPNQRNLMAGVSAFSHTLMRPDELPNVLARAFAVFRSARPRPVHIEMPLDVITANADHLPRRLPMIGGRPAPDPKLVAEAAGLLKDAKRPLVAFGGGAQDAGVAALRLVEALGAPAALTINAKGLLPRDHPLNLGSTLPQNAVQAELAAADVLLAVGTEIGETDWVFGGDPVIKGKLIRVDIDPEQIARNHLPEIGIVGDAAVTLDALADALEGARPRTDGPKRTKAMKEAALAELNPAYQKHRKILAAVKEALPGVIVVGDSTQPIYSGNVFYDADAPRSWFNSATGYGTLGYALPAALGARLGQPERPVVALIGDGGLQFTIGELSTAAELGLPVIVLLWNNRGYKEIKRYMADRDIPQIGVDIYTPDFQTIAKGFGLAAAKAGSLVELDKLLKKAAKANGPTLIEIDEAQALDW
ncbi:MAG: 5-guanidino-2-oxopentanoate decarboxylase [Parvibaculaceae bacterium]